MNRVASSRKPKYRGDSDPAFRKDPLIDVTFPNRDSEFPSEWPRCLASSIDYGKRRLGILSELFDAAFCDPRMGDIDSREGSQFRQFPETTVHHARFR